jgi:hypothetical protein
VDRHERPGDRRGELAPGGAPPTTGVSLSAWISVAVRARRYTRTSSIEPLKFSPQIALPPIRSAPVEARIAPPVAVEDTWVPLT